LRLKNIDTGIAFIAYQGESSLMMWRHIALAKLYRYSLWCHFPFSPCKTECYRIARLGHAIKYKF